MDGDVEGLGAVGCRGVAVGKRQRTAVYPAIDDGVARADVVGKGGAKRIVGYPGRGKVDANTGQRGSEGGCAAGVIQSEADIGDVEANDRVDGRGEERGTVKLLVTLANRTITVVVGTKGVAVAGVTLGGGSRIWSDHEDRLRLRHDR